MEGALPKGDDEVCPVILSDFQTSEKGETNPISTAILSMLLICNIFSSDNNSYQSFFIWGPDSKRKRAGVLISLFYIFKSPAVLHQESWNQCFTTIQKVRNMKIILTNINYLLFNKYKLSRSKTCIFCFIPASMIPLSSTK